MDSFPEWFPLGFQNYLKAEDYSCHLKEPGWKNGFIFISGANTIHQLSYPDLEIADKIKSLLTHPQRSFDCFLFQFWAAVIRDNRCLLTTQNQPFVLNFSKSDDSLWKCRKVCKDKEFYVDSDVEEGDLGIVGRVFRQRSIEATPNVNYYTIQQYPLRDDARNCGIKSLLAIPVFERSSLCCIGVLELLESGMEPPLPEKVNDICQVLRKVGLVPPIEHANYYERHKDEKIKKAMASVPEEIKKTLKESFQIRGVELCQAWAPCTSCNYVSNGDTMMGLLFQKRRTYPRHGVCRLSNASFVHHIRKGQGIVGRALSGMMSLCMDTTELNIIDYPLAHFVRDSKLKGCFAVCLQNDHTGNDLYVLEFFFNYSGDPYTLLYMILEDMKKHLLGFKVASGHELGGRLPIIIIDSQMNTRLDSIRVPEKREWIQQPIMDSMTTGRNDVIHEQSSIPHSIQSIEEIASMQQPSIHITATRRNNVIQDPSDILNFVQISEERESMPQASTDAMMSGRNKVIEEPNNILSSCSDQAREIDATRTKYKGPRIPVGMSNINETLDFTETADGEALQQWFFGQPSKNCTNIEIDDAGENPNGILNSNSQQIRTTNTVGKQCRKSGIPITLEDIQGQHGKKLDDAANSLGVSRSTLKRACRAYDIKWWRYGKRKKGALAITKDESYKRNNGVKDVTEDQIPSSDIPSNSNSPHQPTMAANTNYMPLESNNNVYIKVRYGDEKAIKFRLPTSCGIAELQQHVVKRLHWVDFGTHTIQYMDEENDLILLANNEDLQDCLSSSMSSGKTIVTLYLNTFSISC